MTSDEKTRRRLILFFIEAIKYFQSCIVFQYYDTSILVNDPKRQDDYSLYNKSVTLKFLYLK